MLSFAVPLALLVVAADPPCDSESWALSAEIAVSDASSKTTRSCAVVYFDAIESARVWWELCNDGSPIVLRRRTGGAAEELKTEAAGPPALPWHVELLRRGSYFFLSVNGAEVAWTNHPAAGIDCKDHRVDGDEPLTADAGVETTGGGLVSSSASSQCVEWESELPTAPILTHGGGNGSWYEGQLFPGALLSVNGTHYLFVCGSDLASPGQESGGHVRVGVAHSKDLRTWTLNPRPILDLGPAGAWDNANVFVNGASYAPDGRIVLTYAADAYPARGWGGIGLAFAPSPLGPFEKYEHNPVLPLGAKGAWDSGAIHEHTLVRLTAEESSKTVAKGFSYVLFYTGFGGTGDQGGLAFSNDLLNWTKSTHNPVLRHDTDGNNWDSAHRRPRSLDLINGTWYLLYEGATGVNDGCYRDSVGLARSADLLTWETHPLRVAIAQQPAGRFDAVWTGWPRALVDHDAGAVHLFHSAGGNDFVDKGAHHFASTGLRSVPLDRYVGW